MKPLFFTIICTAFLTFSMSAQEIASVDFENNSINQAVVSTSKNKVIKSIKKEVKQSKKVKSITTKTAFKKPQNHRAIIDKKKQVVSRY